MNKWVIAALLLAAAVTGMGVGYFLNPVGVPPVKGYLEGMEIRFIHTEASDPQVADRLTVMMGSPVLVVPSLAKMPEETLAAVYVFKNGVHGNGPFGFQPDVFANPPGTSGYTPLRSVVLVSWRNEAVAWRLKSAAEVEAGFAKGDLELQRSGVVVNMPLLTWPGGRR